MLVLLVPGVGMGGSPVSGAAFLAAWAVNSNSLVGAVGGVAVQKNTASQKIGAQMVSASDGSAFTGSVTVSVTGDAGTQATGSVGSGACTHEGNGYHTYAPSQAETNYDLIAFTFTGTGAIPTTVQAFTRADANVTHLLGTAWLTPGTAGTPDVNTKLAGGTAWGSGAITAASIASDAITDAKVASDVTIASVTGAVGSVTGNVGGNVTGSVGSVTTGGITSASFAAGAINAAAIASDAITDAKVASDVTIASVTGAVGSVTGSVGSVTGNVGGNVVGSVGSVSGAVGSVTGNVGGNVTGSVGSIATGGIAAASFAAGAIDAAAIAADAIGASELAADAVAEIQSGLSTLTAAGIRTAVGLASANLDTQLSTIDDFLDTEIAAIKAKTDNLPSDPADASDIAASFSTVNSTLATIAGYIDTEVAAIYSRIGAPAGASIAADIAAVKVDSAAILDDTGTSGVVVVAGSKTGYTLAAAGLDSITVESGLNGRQALSIIASSVAGVLAGAATSSITIAAAGVSATNRVTATVDSDGNRTAVSLSPPA